MIVTATIAVTTIIALAIPRASFAQSHTSSIQSGDNIVAVASRDIRRGATLQKDDINWTDSSGVAAQRPHTNSNLVRAGWITQRAIRRGEPLTRPSVTPPPLVTTGALVTARYHAQEISLSLRGTAVGTGSRGDTIYIRTSNRKRIPAIVTAPDTVLIIPSR